MIKKFEDEINIIERNRSLYISFDYSSCNKQECIELYHKWYTSSLILFKQYFDFKDSDLIKFEDVDNSVNGFSLRDNYNKIQSAYFVLLNRLRIGHEVTMESKNVIRKPLLFISHSSDDDKFVKPLVRLLQTLGFNKSNLFCSSVEGFGIDVGDDIYDTLRSKFHEYDIYVVFVLSDNYYSSPACLNEMGAAWILQVDYFTILTNGFSIPEIKGAINPKKMAIVASDDEHIRSMLNSFKTKLLGIFNLPNINEDIVWENNRNDFISTIKRLSY